MAAVTHLLGIGESSNHSRGLPPRVSTTPVPYKYGTSVVLVRYESGLLRSLGLAIPHFVFAVTTTPVDFLGGAGVTGLAGEDSLLHRDDWT